MGWRSGCTYDGLGVFGAGGAEAEFTEVGFGFGGEGVEAGFGGLWEEVGFGWCGA